MSKKMVVRYADGRVAKGYSHDFFPSKDRFQLIDKDTGETSEVRVEELKAVFFVKSFDTDGKLRSRDDIERFGLGRKLRVSFRDGEELLGFSTTYSPGRQAFLLVPGDPDSNSEKVMVITSATESVEFI